MTLDNCRIRKFIIIIFLPAISFMDFPDRVFAAREVNSKEDLREATAASHARLSSPGAAFAHNETRSVKPRRQTGAAKESGAWMVASEARGGEGTEPAEDGGKASPSLGLREDDKDFTEDADEGPLGEKTFYDEAIELETDEDFNPDYDEFDSYEDRLRKSEIIGDRNLD